MEKLKKLSKVMNVVFKLILLFTVVEFIVFLVKLGTNEIALLMENPGKNVVRISEIDLRSFELHFANGKEPNMTTKLLITEIIIEVCAAVFQLAVNMFLIITFGKLLRPLTQGQPYDGTVSRTLKKLGVGCILIGIGKNVISYLLAWAGAHRMAAFLNGHVPDTINSINAQFGINLGLIFIGALILVFSLVFRYGEELQVQADETL